MQCRGNNSEGDKVSQNEIDCIKGESNPRRVDGNDPGYHYPINAWINALVNATKGSKGPSLILPLFASALSAHGSIHSYIYVVITPSLLTMAPRKSRQMRNLKQLPLQFGSRKSGAGAGGKGKLTKSVSAPSTSTSSHTAPPARVTVVDSSDIEEISAPERESSVEQISEADLPFSISKGKTVDTEGTDGNKLEVDRMEDIEEAEEEAEEEPPRKKRRVSRRTTKTTVELPSDDEAEAPRPKRGKAKGKKRGSSKALKSVSPRGAASKRLSITAKGSGKLAEHIDLFALRKHFGEIREKMGSITPSKLLLYCSAVNLYAQRAPVHAEDRSMEDHILHFFDLYVNLASGMV